MKTLVSILSIIALVFIVAFFTVQIAVIKNDAIMSSKLQAVFGIGLLIISICIFTFLIITLFRGTTIPTFVEVNLFEFFFVAVLMSVVSLFLIYNL